MQKTISSWLAILLLIGVTGCDDTKTLNSPQQEINSSSNHDQTSVKPSRLGIQEIYPKIALPFCETKNCIEIDLQSIQTEDTWLDQWIERQIAMAIQHQIGLKQQMTIQQAVDAYVRASDAADADTPYHLAVYTRLPYQRHPYVLLQIGVDTLQNGVEVSGRYYFSVINRELQRSLSLLDVMDEKQQLKANQYIQTAYQQWLTEQNEQIQNQAPAKLYWGQADWFFDQSGVGLHYRAGEITQDSPSFNLYLTAEQTAQILKAEIYQQMFAHTAS